MTFLKTVLVILLVYYLLKILLRWFAPKLFVYAAKRTEQHFKAKFQEFQRPTSEEKQYEGAVSVDKKPKQKTNPSKKVGEYIDFEEIE